MKPHPGLFISFEGGEGGGKTTQINKLAETLMMQGHKVITTREPGGTQEGNTLRELIVQRDNGDWSPMAETLIVLAARVMHIEKVIQPALDNGDIIISDRFSDSTLAYQGYGHGLSRLLIEQLDSLAINALKPDLTFILDIDPQIGLKRSHERLAAEQFEENRSEDRFERLGVDFHEKIRNGFLEIAQNAPDRCVVIDATQPIETMSKHIIEETLKRVG